MSYRVEFDSGALVRLYGLPSMAFDGMLDRLVDLVDAPWDADLTDPRGDPANRQVVFGQGLGLISFRVDDSFTNPRTASLTHAAEPQAVK